MLLLRLWNYLHGYVIILVEGYFLEKFINICIHRQIFLWDIKRQKNSTMTLKVSIKGFKAIKPVARKTSCRVRLMAKKGMPFLLNRYRKRKAFALGAFLFIAIIYTFSSFIWVVEVNGNKRLEDNVILDNLADMGIKPGILKYGIDTDLIVNRLMLENSDLAWVEVEVKGTRVKVDVAERVKRPELIPLDEPCDIVANKDGLIHSVIAKEGQEAVKAGDTVIKGQVLISGTITAANEEKTTQMVHALGEVYARTWYEGAAPVKTVVEEKKGTGKTKNSYTLVFFEKRIKLPFGKVHFSRYDTSHSENRLRLGKDFILPFSLKVNRYTEYRMVKKVLSQEEANNMAMELIYDKVSSSIPEGVRIVNTKKDFVQGDNGSMEARVSIECLEDIGITSEIGGN